MWYVLLYVMAGGIVGFLGGAWLANARRGEEFIAARVLADTVRNVVHEFDPPRNSPCPHPCCHQLLRLALKQYDQLTLGATTEANSPMHASQNSVEHDVPA